jgi:hypothetical protein
LKTVADVKKKTAELQRFLAATEKIRDLLDEDESETKVQMIQDNVAARDEAIKEIKIINDIIDQPAESDGQFDVELEKHSWLWTELMKQIQALEKGNEEKIQKLMSAYMAKVRSTKDSIKVIDAYARPVMDGSGGNIDKKQ